MANDSQIRQGFHAKLDRDLDRKIKEIEEERHKGHEWIDSAPESVLRALGTSGELALHVEHFVPKMALYEPMKSIVESIEPETDITSPLIYDALLQSMPELESEDEWKLKARIAATLGRLVDNKVLKLEKQGRGSAPSIYRLRSNEYALLNAVLEVGKKARGK